MADGLPTNAPSEDAAIDLSRTEPFVVGGLEVRPGSREVGSGKLRELIEPRMLRVLVALAQETGRVVSRERLVARCWDRRVVSDDSINTCVGKLRKVGETHRAFMIETVPRVGYRLVATASLRSTSVESRKTWLAAAVMLLVSLLGAGAWITLQPQPPSFQVEVAPFRADEQGEALAAQIREKIAGTLSERGIDVLPISAQRSAPFLVRGAVETQGGAARVRIVIEDERADLVLWQGELTGATGFQSHLPEQSAAKVSGLITSGRDLFLSSKARAPPAALKAYMLGMESYRERRNIIEHLAFMRSMHELAPKVPLVRTAYAFALIEAAREQPPEVERAWRAEAATEAQAAIRSDPKLGMAYSALSNAIDEKDFAQRMRILQRGLQRAPLDGPLNSHASLLMAQVGRPMQGLPYSRRGHSIDPDAAPRAFHNADYLISVGLVNEGRREMEEARRRWPTNERNPQYQTLMALQSLTPAEGAALVRAIQTQFPDAVPAALWLDVFDALECHCHQAETGRKVRAAAVARQTPASLAFIALTRLGRLDEAFEVARLSQLDGMLCEYRLLFAPQTAPMRRDPRFMDLAQNLGLAHYWRTSGQWPEFCAEPGLPYDCKIEAARAAAAS